MSHTKFGISAKCKDSKWFSESTKGDVILDFVRTLCCSLDPKEMAAVNCALLINSENTAKDYIESAIDLNVNDLTND